MSITQIDLDDDALAEAMRLSDAKSRTDAVNLALREFVARHSRIASLERHAEVSEGWDYEGLMRSGAHRAFSCVDLLLCACAASHGLTILHDDNDFATAARFLTDVSARRVLELPA